MQPNECQFDSEDLIDRLMNNEDMARRVAGAFIDGMPQQLAALAAAIGSSDAKGTMLAAHSIKGAAANASSPAVKDFASQLEKMGADGTLGSAPQAMSELAAAFQSLKPVIERFRDRKS